MRNLKIGLLFLVVGLVSFLVYKNNIVKPPDDPVYKKVDLVPYISPTSSPEEKAACESSGGVWKRWGLIGEEYCQIPASDGGKSCNNGSECILDKCISEENKAPGKCQTYKNTFGCFSYIEDGKVTGAICID